MHVKSQKTMNKILNKSAQSIIEDSDIVVFVLQRLSLNNEDISIIKKLKETNPFVICVINKIDQISKKDKLLPFIDDITKMYNFASIIPISAEIGIMEAKLYILVMSSMKGSNLSFLLI